jgi:hypothetical protein
MQHEHLVEATMLGAPRPPLDVIVTDVNLGGLRESGELLVCRLARDDARALCVEVLETQLGKL